MKVAIKKFNVAMEVKNKGIELEVYGNGEDAKFLGDCVITKTGLTWCEGKTRPENGKKVTWGEFTKWMNGKD